MFFKNNDTLNLMNAFINKTIALSFEDKDQQSRLTISTSIIEIIINDPQVWDENCKFNIERIGESFINSISRFTSNEPETIDRIYVFLYRFLCELEFTLDNKKELSINLSNLKQQIFDSTDTFSSHLRSQLIYASYTMPIGILKDLINNPSFTNLHEFNNTIEKAKKLKLDWDSEISEKNESVNTLKNKLDEYEIGFNFVGLYEGFNKLSTNKNSELKWLLSFLVFMGCVILSPLIIELTISISNANNNNFNLNSLYTLIPIASIEIILIYYFRIILSQYTSVKAQLVQIELRKTLCQFIQNYSEYSMKIKEKDPSVLDKFENLIFSSVLTDPEKIPSTFDGIEQIGSLIKNLRSS